MAKKAWKTYTGAILTVGLCNSLSAFVGNAVYETSLSFVFIQLVKCFTPVIVLLVGLAAGVETLNARVAGAVVIISAGMVMCVNGELNAEIFGIFLVIVGGFSEALRLARGGGGGKAAGNTRILLAPFFFFFPSPLSHVFEYDGHKKFLL